MGKGGRGRSWAPTVEHRNRALPANFTSRRFVAEQQVFCGACKCEGGGPEMTSGVGEEVVFDAVQRARLGYGCGTWFLVFFLGIFVVVGLGMIGAVSAGSIVSGNGSVAPVVLFLLVWVSIPIWMLCRAIFPCCAMPWGTRVRAVRRSDGQLWLRVKSSLAGIRMESTTPIPPSTSHLALLPLPPVPNVPQFAQHSSVALLFVEDSGKSRVIGGQIFESPKITAEAPLLRDSLARSLSSALGHPVSTDLTGVPLHMDGLVGGSRVLEAGIRGDVNAAEEIVRLAMFADFHDVERGATGAGDAFGAFRPPPSAPPPSAPPKDEHSKFLTYQSHPAPPPPSAPTPPPPTYPTYLKGDADDIAL